MVDRPFSLLIKPTGAECNLKCDYCFFLDRPVLHQGEKNTRMSDAVLEAMIAKFMAVEQPLHAFCWQGGEPTMMGLPFFERVVGLQKKYGRRGAVVANSVQTNATLITDEMAEFFRRYRFLVGASRDGAAEVHDRFRRTESGADSHDRVDAGIDRLEAAGVPHDMLVVVSTANVDRPHDVYRELVGQGKLHHHYIPCVEVDAQGRPTPESIDGPQWGRFLLAIFDLWKQEDLGRVSIRLFESTASKLMTGRATLCTQADRCEDYLVVEYDGGVYPCDFYVEPRLRLGDVFGHTFEELRGAEEYRRFAAEKSNLPAACRSCPQLDLCGGDCPRNRVDEGAGPSRLCEGWLRFFEAARAELLAAAQPRS